MRSHAASGPLCAEHDAQGRCHPSRRSRNTEGWRPQRSKSASSRVSIDPRWQWRSSAGTTKSPRCRPSSSGPAGTARAGALVLEGEAGIGKSTLWLAGVDAAHERGLRVLSARPAESEQGLAYAGLGDLLEDCRHRGAAGAFGAAPTSARGSASARGGGRSLRRPARRRGGGARHAAGAGKARRARARDRRRPVARSRVGECALVRAAAA